MEPNTKSAATLTSNFYHLLPAKAAALFREHKVRFRCDGNTGGGVNNSIAAAGSAGCYDPVGDAVHFPVAGPQNLSTALHEFGHWTGGRFRTPRIRTYGIPEWLLEVMPREAKIEVRLGRIMGVSFSDYVADELIAESFAAEMLRRLGEPADPESDKYLAHYMNMEGQPDWFVAIHSELLKIGRELAARFV